MGSLNLPASGVVYVDTQISIYTVEKFPNYAPLCLPLWQAGQASVITIVSSELSLLETLVMPLRNQDAALISDYRHLLLHSDMKLLPITQEILEDAARLRAQISGLKTPDAIHAATALRYGCALFITNDTGFRRVPGLPLVLLDEVFAAP